jgi:hypothetical protein
MDQICAGYEDKDLQLLTGFLRRTADAARTAAEKLTQAELAGEGERDTPPVR